MGRVVGFETLGYIGWAKKWADAPIRIISDNIGKVTFPLLSRVQESKEKIRDFEEKILRYQTAIVAPVLIGMASVMSLFVEIIPRYQKWEPAIPLFYIFALSSLIVSFAIPFMNLYNAQGRVKVTFSFMIFFTALTWILTPFLVSKNPLFGFPLAHLIVSTSMLAIIFKAKKETGLKFFQSVYKFAVASFAMGFVVWFIQKLVVNVSLPLLFGLSVFLGAVLYYFILRFSFGVNLVSDFKSFYQKK